MWTSVGGILNPAVDALMTTSTNLLKVHNDPFTKEEERPVAKLDAHYQGYIQKLGRVTKVKARILAKRPQPTTC